MKIVGRSGGKSGSAINNGNLLKEWRERKTRNRNRGRYGNRGRGGRDRGDGSQRGRGQRGKDQRGKGQGGRSQRGRGQGSRNQGDIGQIGRGQAGGGQVGGQGVDRNAFQQGSLIAHNKLRQIHGTSPMRLSKEMCDEAEAYAKVLAQQGSLKHDNSKDGENLALGCSSAADGGLSGAEATKRW